ncbi:hypothetical protein WR25_08275 [Diploscapter pachys]|uniref:Protein-tyrosine-phosphatase n=1 Tax=Diploscapter pachys TaxID=2018661 RepID=A0A2A2LHK0_9BILA|nr:hypothetical protein WR25_08275 [Diploscapter pachys]
MERKLETDENMNVEAVEVVERPRQLYLPHLITGLMPAESVSTEHCISKFPSIMKLIHRDNNRVLKEEFKFLDDAQNRRYQLTTIATMHNDLNRYHDVLPFDENRIVLSHQIGDGYINASPILGFNTKTYHFIAAMGPMDADEAYDRGKRATVDQFWAMIVQKNVHHIVMLTETTENGVAKCAQYWPKDVGETVNYDGEITVVLVAETHDNICTTREFNLEFRGYLRRIRQFHYKSWNDRMGVENQWQLARFVERVMQVKDRPILVHCSAGIGRTGVFIALFNIYDRAKKEGIVNVYEEVNNLRRQRRGMVLTLEQYICIYDTLLYLIDPPIAPTAGVKHY